LDERGGFVTVKVSWPHKSFKGSENMGISSMNLSWSPKSYTMSETINFHKKLSLEIYDAPTMGLVAPYYREPSNNLKDIVDPTAFM